MAESDPPPPARSLTRRFTFARPRARGFSIFNSIFNSRRVRPVTVGIEEEKPGASSRSPSRSPSRQVKRPERCTRYTHPDEIWNALEKRDVRLVRMSWLLNRHQANKKKRRGRCVLIAGRSGDL